MKHLFFTVVALVCYAVPSCTADEENYWLKFSDLLGKETPQEWAAAREYLMSLTKDQLLIAVRQYGKIVDEKYPAKGCNGWGVRVIPVYYIMGCYQEPPLSAEEIAKLPPGRVKRNYEAGGVPGPLTDVSYDKLIAGITDNKESAFFRYALARYAAVDNNASPVLNGRQKERLFDTYLAVIIDRKSPEVVRCVCCEMAVELYRRVRWDIIHSDNAVKEWLRKDWSERRGIKSTDMIISGEIKLNAETIKQLEPWQQRAQVLRKQLTYLQDDTREPESLRKLANKHLKELDRLPPLPLQNVLDSSTEKYLWISVALSLNDFVGIRNELQNEVRKGEKRKENIVLFATCGKRPPCPEQRELRSADWLTMF